MTEDFKKDFDAVFGKMRELCSKHTLPEPTIIFPPEWHGPVFSTLSRVPSIMTFENFGIKFSIGRIREERVTRID